jgi:DNA-binding MarR family transcriptional regulator
MEQPNLNENDNKLLAYCLEQRRTISQIARFLGIAPKNVSIRIKKLGDANLIKIEQGGKGKKTFVRTIEGIKTNDFAFEILKKIKEKKEVSLREYDFLLGNDLIGDSQMRDKMNALNLVLYSDLVERIVRLTKEGEELLKEGNKSKEPHKN